MFPLRVFAEEIKNDCPDEIATISESVLALAGQKIIHSIYKELGCEIAFEPLPARRAFVAFNQYTVDGELYRLPIIEKNIPGLLCVLMYLSLLLSTHYGDIQSLILYPVCPLGIYGGILWQEEYMKGRRAKIFNSFEDLLTAFNNEEVGSFLSADFSISFYQNQKGFKVRPIKSKEIGKADLYHYLGAEFEPFMKRFSNFLVENPTFSEMIIPDGIFVNSSSL